MTTRYFLAPLFLLASVTLAADLPQVPSDPIAKKKEQLFSDDFERAEAGPVWLKVVPTHTLENGALKLTQTRVDTPAADGKPAIVGHQAVNGIEVPTKDSIVELRFKFAGANAISVEFDDRKYTGSHYGHICYARVTTKNCIIMDQKEGTMRNDIYEMKDPAQKEKKAQLLKGKSASFPIQLDLTAWHTLTVETVGDEMRASIDGKPVAFLKSPGIAHPTKSRIEFGCGGKDGFLDDIKVFNAEPAAAK